jgi:hypothetical protein
VYDGGVTAGGGLGLLVGAGLERDVLGTDIPEGMGRSGAATLVLWLLGHGMRGGGVALVGPCSRVGGVFL